MFVASTLPTVPISRPHRGAALAVTLCSCQMQSVTLYTKFLITYSNEPAQHGQQRDIIDTLHLRSSLISATDEDQLLPSRPDCLTSGEIPSVPTERVRKLPIKEIRVVSARN